MSPTESAATAAIQPLAPAVRIAEPAAAAAPRPAYRRILLKLSGEALMGGDSYGIERETIVARGASLWPLVWVVSPASLASSAALLCPEDGRNTVK